MSQDQKPREFWIDLNSSEGHGYMISDQEEIGPLFREVIPGDIPVELRQAHEWLRKCLDELDKEKIVVEGLYRFINSLEMRWPELKGAKE